MAVIKTKHDMVMENAKAISSNQAGIGKIRITNMTTIDKAKKISPRFVEATIKSLNERPPNTELLTFSAFFAMIRL